MGLTYRLKSLVNNLASRFGYRVERIVDYGAHQLNPFHVLIDGLNPRDPNFFFVQVGANDGRTDDPIHQLVARYHWRGVLLEPQPEIFKKLVENYRSEPQLVLENVALAHRDDTLSLWTVANSDGLLASFDRSAIAARYRDPSQIIEVPVQATSFRSLVKRHAISRIDLLVIDTEGFDFEVIKMALAEALLLPRLIRYEHLLLSRADHRACGDLLAQHGYRLLRDGIDTIAYRAESA